ncbi:MAG TPA: heparan-alpha-glucosaminide N-acetyltransferase domain-containing protein [Gemmatimonadales bacterium]|nr:heparan-alpha-glucosaminide N-acetyltransferase domain-containing protein [Gemmatimonadales bacterium]
MPQDSGTGTGPSRRIESIDALRGLVMVIMALDHVRDFVHRGAMTGSPTDLATTTPVLFFTRWITHLCAPAFMLTAGLGAYLWWQRGRTRGELSVFLLTRGLWLIVLEVTVMRLAYNFSFSGEYPLFLIVLWALGGCMIVLAALVWLPLPALAALSLAAIAGHNLLDGFDPARLGAAGLWNVIHQPGPLQLPWGTAFVAYPLVPWVAVMALGFCLGPVYGWDSTRRTRLLLGLGAAATLGFVILRAINRYGDPVAWAAQSSPSYTLLSFLNTTKYPPSLDFLLMTLGPASLALAWLEQRGTRWINPLVVFGRVPLFYFILHFYAAHLSAVALALATYGWKAWAFAFHPVPSMGGPSTVFPAAFGWDLWVAYLVWGVIVVGLYPVCRWFAGVKARRREWWLGYL